jgi:hypothetical protein
MAKCEYINLIEEKEELMKRWQTGAMDTDKYEAEMRELNSNIAECRTVLSRWF